MVDVIDRANDHAEFLLEQAMQQRQASLGVARAEPLTECLDCGHDIPEERRFAIAGCETCVDCQTVREARRGR